MMTPSGPGVTHENNNGAGRPVNTSAWNQNTSSAANRRSRSKLLTGCAGASSGALSGGAITRDIRASRVVLAAVMMRDPLAVVAARRGGKPLRVGEVPGERAAHSAGKSLGGLPAELATDLARIDRVAAIVARAVGDERHQLRVIAAGPQLGQQVAERAHHVEVRHFGVATDVVCLALPTAREHRAYRRAMVADVEPVANVLAVTVDGEWLSGERVDDHQRNEFFGKLPRAVVVRAVAGERRQAERVVIRAHEMIRRGLRRRIWAVRRIRGGFAESCRVGIQRAIDLVRRYVQEAKPVARSGVFAAPPFLDGIDQREGGDDVGVDERRRAMDRAIDMRLGGEVDDRARPVLREESGDQRAVADVAVHEHVARVGRKAREVGGIAGVSQLVEIDHTLVLRGQPVEDEIGADEARAAGDEDHELWAFTQFFIGASARIIVTANAAGFPLARE